MNIQKNSIKIQLIKSIIGVRKSHRETIIGLGLKKNNSVTILQNTPSVKGMINKVSYLLKIY